MTAESNPLHFKLLSQVILEKRLPQNSGWVLLGAEKTELSFPAGDRRKYADEKFIITSVNGVLVFQIVQNDRLGYFTMDGSGKISSADPFFRRKNKIIADRGRVTLDAFKTQLDLLITEIRHNRE